MLAGSTALLVAFCGWSFVAPSVRAAADTLPSRLADQEFWKLVSDLSEPNGTFRSDNLLSNEIELQYVIPDLIRTLEPGGVYMGVGPEQNFTYIAATKPRMVFIVDVRRGNMLLQLLYKSLFELSADRNEFASRLFSKKEATGLDATSTAADLFKAYWSIDTSDALYKENLKAVDEQLVTKHHFPLSDADIEGIEFVYHAFYQFGPELQYSSVGSGFGYSRGQPTYADLMVSTDGNGQPRSYLASESAFAFLKELETRNLLVPLVGNFAGPKAIRAVGQYLKAKGATVTAFYLSNVEQYLRQDGLWGDFCGNVAALPLDETSTFIQSVRGMGYAPGIGLTQRLGKMLDEVKACAPNAAPAQ